MANPTAEIAALEQSLCDLRNRQRDAMRNYVDARMKALDARRQSAIGQEIQAAQRELDSAIDKHPRITALKQEMAHAEVLANAAYSNQGVLQAELTATQQLRVASHTNSPVVIAKLDDIRARQLAELQQANLAPHANFTNMTAQERKKCHEIQKKYRDEFQRIIDEDAHAQDLIGEKEQQMMADLAATGDQCKGYNEHYSQVYYELPNVRARLKAEDPAIAALAEKVSALTLRYNTEVQAMPELVSCQKKIADLKKQQLDVMARLGVLRRQSAAAATNSPPLVTRNQG